MGYLTKERGEKGKTYFSYDGKRSLKAKWQSSIVTKWRCVPQLDIISIHKQLLPIRPTLQSVAKTQPLLNSINHHNNLLRGLHDIRQLSSCGSWKKKTKRRCAHEIKSFQNVTMPQALEKMHYAMQETLSVASPCTRQISFRCAF